MIYKCITLDNHSLTYSSTQIQARSTEEDAGDDNPLTEVVKDLKAKIADLTRRNIALKEGNEKREKEAVDDSKRNEGEELYEAEKAKSVLRGMAGGLFLREAPAAFKRNAKNLHKVRNNVKLHDKVSNTVKLHTK